MKGKITQDRLIEAFEQFLHTVYPQTRMMKASPVRYVRPYVDYDNRAYKGVVFRGMDGSKVMEWNELSLHDDKPILFVDMPIMDGIYGMFGEELADDILKKWVSVKLQLTVGRVVGHELNEELF